MESVKLDFLVVVVEFGYVTKSLELKGIRGHFLDGVSPLFCVATTGVRF